MMTTLGNVGYGLVVWNMSLGGCYEESQSVFESSWYGQPWLVPALCTWRPVHDVDGYLIDEVADLVMDTDDPDYTIGQLEKIPYIYVRDVRFPDETSYHPRTLESNLHSFSSMRGWPNGGPSYNQSTEGIIPAWCVIPIEGSFFATWQEELFYGWCQWIGLGFSDISLCGHASESHDSFCGTSIDDDDAFATLDSDEHLENCEWNGYYGNLMEMVRNEPTFTEEFDDEDTFNEVWAYAVHQYKAGWLRAIELAAEGHPCSSSSLLDWSPYSELSSSLDSVRQPAQQLLIA